MRRTPPGSTCSRGAASWELLQLHGRGDVTLKTQTHPLEAVNDVLDALRQGEITGRAVLVP